MATPNPTPTPQTVSLMMVDNATVLADLQSLTTSVAITGFAWSGSVPQVSWADTPTQEDLNEVASYFQANSPLRVWA